MVPSCMVKHTVQNNLDPSCMQFAQNGSKRVVGTQPRVDFVIIKRIIAMRATLKDRTQVDDINLQLLEIVVPFANLQKPLHGLRVVHIESFGDIPKAPTLVALLSRAAQWEQLVHDPVAIPRRNGTARIRWRNVCKFGRRRSQRRHKLLHQLRRRCRFDRRSSCLHCLRFPLRRSRNLRCLPLDLFPGCRSFQRLLLRLLLL
mmetsp:Transcript_3271/g.5722  ORF Transcript_3271/g.5722 Transcript_3271/m.5722 type:complete len:202 (+) Transcript_3271:465-1070(+)